MAKEDGPLDKTTCAASDSSPRRRSPVHGRKAALFGCARSKMRHNPSQELRWSTQNHASRMKKADIRSCLWLGLILFFICPGFEPAQGLRLSLGSLANTAPINSKGRFAGSGYFLLKKWTPSCCQSERRKNVCRSAQLPPPPPLPLPLRGLGHLATTIGSSKCAGRITSKHANMQHGPNF